MAYGCSFAFLSFFLPVKKIKTPALTKQKQNSSPREHGRYRAIVDPAYDYYGDGTVTTDIFTIMKGCEKDDFEVYKTNGTWEYNEDPTKCDASYPQIVSLPWNFADNETKLILGGDEHAILALTATTLKLRYSFEDAGIIYTEEDTYEH